MTIRLKGDQTLGSDADDVIDGTGGDKTKMGRPPAWSKAPMIIVTDPELQPGDNILIGGWRSGWTATQIGDATKRTKNAVVGRAHRLMALGVLQSRGNPIIYGAEPKPQKPRRAGAITLSPLPSGQGPPVTSSTAPPFIPGTRSLAHQQKAARVSAALRTQVQGPTLPSPPVAPEPSPVTSEVNTPSAWFGGQVALPAPRRAMPDWMTRPIPRAKACLFPLWADHQHCYDVAQPFCDAPTLVTRAYDGEPKVHVYCGKHHAVAHTRTIKSANQAPTW